MTWRDAPVPGNDVEHDAVVELIVVLASVGEHVDGETVELILRGYQP